MSRVPGHFEERDMSCLIGPLEDCQTVKILVATLYIDFVTVQPILTGVENIGTTFPFQSTSKGPTDICYMSVNTFDQDILSLSS